MSKRDDMQNTMTLGELLGNDSQNMNLIDDDPVVVDEVVTEPTTEQIVEDAFNIIAPDPSQFEEMRKVEDGPKIPTPRESYITFLIDQQGMSIAEATKAANQVYPEDVPVSQTNPAVSAVRNDPKPEVVVVNVDKTNADSLQFTDSEREKLIVSKAIRMNVLEDESLKAIKIKSSIGGKKKMAFVESFAGKLNQYSIPMLPVL